MTDTKLHRGDQGRAVREAPAPARANGGAAVTAAGAARMQAASTNIDAIVDVLTSDLEGWLPNNEERIFSALRNRTPGQIQAIRAAYQRRNKHSLDSALAADLSATELREAKALLSCDPVQIAVATLRSAMEGMGTDEAKVKRALAPLRNASLKARVIAEYERATGTPLHRALATEGMANYGVRPGDYAPPRPPTAPRPAPGTPPPGTRRAAGTPAGGTSVTPAPRRPAAPAPLSRESKSAASALNAATDRWGTDETGILETLKGKTPAQIAEIKRAFREHTGKDLVTVLEGEMSGAELVEAKALLSTDPVQIAVSGLRNASEGLGTNTGKLLDVLKGMVGDAGMRQRVKARFEQQTGQSLEVMIRAELSGFDRDKALAYLRGEKAAIAAVEVDAAMRGNFMTSVTDAVADTVGVRREGLRVDTGTDETALYAALEQAKTPQEKAALREAFRRRTGKTLDAELHSELNKNERQVASSVMSGDQVAAQAAKLHMAAAGIGTDRAAIYAVLQEAPDQATRDRIVAKFNELYKAQYPSRRGRTPFDEMMNGELDALDAEKARQLARTGKLDDGFALYYAMNEGMFGIGTDEAALTARLAGKSKTDIARIRREYARAASIHGGRANASLDADIAGETSGRDGHQLGQALKGNPETAAELRERAREDYEFERKGSGWAGDAAMFAMLGPAGYAAAKARGATSASLGNSITDTWSGTGRRLDATHAAVEAKFAAMRNDPRFATYSSLKPGSPERIEMDRQMLAELQGATDWQEGDLKGFVEAKDVTADMASTAVAIAVGAVVAIASGGTAAPAVIALISGLAGVGTQMIVKGAAMSNEEIIAALASTIAEAAAAGVVKLRAIEALTSNVARLTAGNKVLLARIVQESVEEAVESGSEELINAMLDPSLYRGDLTDWANGVVQRTGRAFSTGGVVGGLASGVGTRIPQGTTWQSRAAHGATTQIIGSSATAAVDPSSYEGTLEERWARYGRTVGEAGLTGARATLGSRDAAGTNTHDGYTGTAPTPTPTTTTTPTTTPTTTTDTRVDEARARRAAETDLAWEQHRRSQGITETTPAKVAADTEAAYALRDRRAAEIRSGEMDAMWDSRSEGFPGTSVTETNVRTNTETSVRTNAETTATTGTAVTTNTDTNGDTRTAIADPGRTPDRLTPEVRTVVDEGRTMAAASSASTITDADPMPEDLAALLRPRTAQENAEMALRPDLWGPIASARGKQTYAAMDASVPAGSMRLIDGTIVSSESRQLSAEARAWLGRRRAERRAQPSKPRSVVVDGGGPAGVMAALNAFSMGHEVTIVEMREASTLPVLWGNRPELRQITRLIDAELEQRIYTGDQAAGVVKFYQHINEDGTYADPYMIPETPLHSDEQTTGDPRFIAGQSSEHHTQHRTEVTAMWDRLSELAAQEQQLAAAEGREPRLKILRGYQTTELPAEGNKRRVVVERLVPVWQKQGADGRPERGADGKPVTQPAVEGQQPPTGWRATTAGDGNPIDLGAPDDLLVASGANSKTRALAGAEAIDVGPSQTFMAGYFEGVPMSITTPEGETLRGGYISTSERSRGGEVLQTVISQGVSPDGSKATGIWGLPQVDETIDFNDAASIETYFGMPMTRQDAIMRYYKERVARALAVDPSTIPDESFSMRPAPFELQSKVSGGAADDATNVRLIGDARGNSHFFAGLGKGTGTGAHQMALRQFWESLQSGTDPDLAGALLDRRLDAATRVWLKYGLPSFNDPDRPGMLVGDADPDATTAAAVTAPSTGTDAKAATSSTQTDTHGQAAAIANSSFHGNHTDGPALTPNDVTAQLKRLGYSVVTVIERSAGGSKITVDGTTLTVQLPDGTSRTVTVNLASQAMEAVATFAIADVGAVIEISPQARLADLERALAHEIAEIVALWTGTASNTESSTHVGGLTAHDVGRVAEMNVLLDQFQTAAQSTGSTNTNFGDRADVVSEVRALLGEMGLPSDGTVTSEIEQRLGPVVTAQLRKLFFLSSSEFKSVDTGTTGGVVVRGTDTKIGKSGKPGNFADGGTPGHVMATDMKVVEHDGFRYDPLTNTVTDHENHPIEISSLPAETRDALLGKVPHVSFGTSGLQLVNSNNNRGTAKVGTGDLSPVRGMAPFTQTAMPGADLGFGQDKYLWGKMEGLQEGNLVLQEFQYGFSKAFVQPEGFRIREQMWRQQQQNMPQERQSYVLATSSVSDGQQVGAENRQVNVHESSKTVQARNCATSVVEVFKGLKTVGFDGFPAEKVLTPDDFAMLGMNADGSYMPGRDLRPQDVYEHLRWKEQDWRRRLGTAMAKNSSLDGEVKAKLGEQEYALVKRAVGG